VLEDHVAQEEDVDGLENQFVTNTKMIVHGETKMIKLNKKDVASHHTNVVEKIVF